MMQPSAWVGYCEHKTPAFLGIPDVNIGKGYTIFADMTRLPQGLPWCAIFVHAVIERPDLLGRPHPGTRVLARRMKRRGLYRGKTYKPRPGDLIFLSNSRTDKIDHCGIVEGYDGKNVTSIEGNARDAKGRFEPHEGGVVARRTRETGDSLIVGYAELTKGNSL